MLTVAQIVSGLLDSVMSIFVSVVYIFNIMLLNIPILNFHYLYVLLIFFLSDECEICSVCM